jgi:phosphomannomutase
VLNLLAASGKTLADILAARTRYHMVKRKVARGDVDAEDIYRLTRAGVPAGADENTEDGLRLEWPDAREWLHVRPSGTEPILRLIAEAPTPERAEHLVLLAAESMNAGAN